MEKRRGFSFKQKGRGNGERKGELPSTKKKTPRWGLRFLVLFLLKIKIGIRLLFMPNARSFGLTAARSLRRLPWKIPGESPGSIYAALNRQAVARPYVPRVTRLFHLPFTSFLSQWAFRQNQSLSLKLSCFRVIWAGSKTVKRLRRNTTPYHT